MSVDRGATKIPVGHDNNLAQPSGLSFLARPFEHSSDAARVKERARDEDEERLAKIAPVAECPGVLESDCILPWGVHASLSLSEAVLRIRTEFLYSVSRRSHQLCLMFR